MKVRATLFAPLGRLAEMETFWTEGGGGSLPRTSPNGHDVTLVVADMSGKQGELLEGLAELLGEVDNPEVLVNRVAIFEADDYSQAELFALGVGEISSGIDPASVTSRARCMTCGMGLPRRSQEAGVCFVSVPKYDFFRAQQLWFVSETFRSAMQDLSGVSHLPVQSLSHVHELIAAGKIGRALGPEYGPRCKACGQKRGQAPSPREQISGLLRYDRSTWDGSDLASDGAQILVSQAARKTLTRGTWRIPGDGITFRPVFLIDAAIL